MGGGRWNVKLGRLFKVNVKGVTSVNFHAELPAQRSASLYVGLLGGTCPLPAATVGMIELEAEGACLVLGSLRRCINDGECSVNTIIPSGTLLCSSQLYARGNRRPDRPLPVSVGFCWDVGRYSSCSGVV